MAGLFRLLDRHCRTAVRNLRPIVDGLGLPLVSATSTPPTTTFGPQFSSVSQFSRYRRPVSNSGTKESDDEELWNWIARLAEIHEKKELWTWIDAVSELHVKIEKGNRIVVIGEDFLLQLEGAQNLWDLMLTLDEKASEIRELRDDGIKMMGKDYLIKTVYGESTLPTVRTAIDKIPITRTEWMHIDEKPEEFSNEEGIRKYDRCILFNKLYKIYMRRKGDNCCEVNGEDFSIKGEISEEDDRWIFIDKLRKIHDIKEEDRWIFIDKVNKIYAERMGDRVEVKGEDFFIEIEGTENILSWLRTLEDKLSKSHMERKGDGIKVKGEDFLLEVDNLNGLLRSIYPPPMGNCEAFFAGLCIEVCRWSRNKSIAII